MEQKKVTYNSLKDIPDAAWTKLSQEKIYFGHQSVGYNIIDGIKDLMKENPKIKLNIVGYKDVNGINGGFLAHSRVGKNREPQTKIDDFENVLAQGIGRKVDTVALKFCYVDITGETDVEQLFNQYKNRVEKIKKQYPELNIIHFTVPLRSTELNMKIRVKNIVKKILGKHVEDDKATNIVRNEYNKLIRSAFQGKEPILDIAKVESTFPDGTRCTFEAGEDKYFSMAPEYTYDGGHLNNLGRKKVAEQLLLLLVNL